jgi:uncharacterized protein YcfJ
MRRIASIVTLFATAVLGTGLAAEPATTYYDYARVVHVEPLTRYVEVPEPRRECWRAPVERHYRRSSTADATAGVLVGGILGGVIGHQIGGGDGRRAATAVGTVIGAGLGHSLAEGGGHGARDYQVTHERRCRVYDAYRTEERIDGYRVTYRYDGQTFVTRTEDHPGKRLRVQVRLEPLEG